MPAKKKKGCIKGKGKKVAKKDESLTWHKWRDLPLVIDFDSTDTCAEFWGGDSNTSFEDPEKYLHLIYRKFGSIQNWHDMFISQEKKILSKWHQAVESKERSAQKMVPKDQIRGQKWANIDSFRYSKIALGLTSSETDIDQLKQFSPLKSPNNVNLWTSFTANFYYEKFNCIQLDEDSKVVLKNLNFAFTLINKLEVATRKKKSETNDQINRVDSEQSKPIEDIGQLNDEISLKVNKKFLEDIIDENTQQLKPNEVVKRQKEEEKVLKKLDQFVSAAQNLSTNASQVEKLSDLCQEIITNSILNSYSENFVNKEQELYSENNLSILKRINEISDQILKMVDNRTPTTCLELIVQTQIKFGQMSQDIFYFAQAIELLTNLCLIKADEKMSLDIREIFKTKQGNETSEKQEEFKRDDKEQKQKEEQKKKESQEEHEKLLANYFFKQEEICLKDEEPQQESEKAQQSEKLSQTTPIEIAAIISDNVVDNFSEDQDYLNVLLIPHTISQRASNYLTFHRILLNLEKITKSMDRNDTQLELSCQSKVYQNISEITIFHLKWLEMSDKFNLQDIMGGDKIAQAFMTQLLISILCLKNQYKEEEDFNFGKQEFYTIFDKFHMDMTTEVFNLIKTTDFADFCQIQKILLDNSQNTSIVEQFMLNQAEYLLKEAMKNDLDSQKGPIFTFYYNFIVRNLKQLPKDIKSKNLVIQEKFRLNWHLLTLIFAKLTFYCQQKDNIPKQFKLIRIQLDELLVDLKQEKHYHQSLIYQTSISLALLKENVQSKEYKQALLEEIQGVYEDFKEDMSEPCSNLLLACIQRLSITEFFQQNVNQNDPNECQINGSIQAGQLLQSDLLASGLEIGTFCVLPKKFIDECLNMIADFKGQNEDLYQTLRKAQSHEFDSQVKLDKLLANPEFNFQAIFDQNECSFVEISIAGIQRILAKQGGPMQAIMQKLGGLQGDKLTRYAFAVMLKFQNLSFAFSNLILNIELEIAGDPSEQTQQAQMDSFDAVAEEFDEKELAQLVQCWSSASQMRRWLTNKKQSLAEKFVNLTTQNKGYENSEIKSEVDEKTLADKETKTAEYVDRELNKILESIQEKAKLLICMRPPSYFKQSDDQINHQSSQNSETMLLKKPSYLQKKQSQVSQKPNDNNLDGENAHLWQNDIQSWQKEVIEQCKEEFEKIAQLRFKEAGTNSVLACLQSPISRSEIEEEIGSVLVKSCKRLRILDEILKWLNLRPNCPKHAARTVLYLKIALVGQQQKLYHYSDALKGCGKLFEGQLQKKFFEILSHYHRQIVQLNLARSKEETEKDKQLFQISYNEDCAQSVEMILLSVFRCRLKSSDYAFFTRELPIFSLIFNAKKFSDTNQKHLIDILEDKSSASDFSLQNQQLRFEWDLFKEHVVSILSRQIDQGNIEEINLKNQATSKTRVPQLVRRASLLDKNHAEQLLGQALSNIFRFFNEVNDRVKQMQRLKSDEECHEKSDKKSQNAKKVDQNQPSEVVNLEIKTGEEQNLKEKEKDSEENKDESSENEIVKEDISDKMSKGGDQSDQSENQSPRKKMVNEFKLDFIKKSKEFLSEMCTILHLIANVSLKSTNMSLMLKLISTPYHISILLNLLFSYTHASTQLKIVKVLQILHKNQVPMNLFDSAVSELNEAKSSSLDDLRIVFAESISGKYLKLMAKYAVGIRMGIVQELKDQQNMALSKSILKLVLQRGQKAEINEGFQQMWSNLLSLNKAEQSMAFEIIGCALWRPDVGDEVYVDKKLCQVSLLPIDPKERFTVLSGKVTVRRDKPQSVQIYSESSQTFRRVSISSLRQASLIRADHPNYIAISNQILIQAINYLCKDESKSLIKASLMKLVAQNLDRLVSIDNILSTKFKKFCSKQTKQNQVWLQTLKMIKKGEWIDQIRPKSWKDIANATNLDLIESYLAINYRIKVNKTSDSQFTKVKEEDEDDSSCYGESSSDDYGEEEGESDSSAGSSSSICLDESCEGESQNDDSSNSSSSSSGSNSQSSSLTRSRRSEKESRNGKTAAAIDLDKCQCADCEDSEFSSSDEEIAADKNSIRSFKSDEIKDQSKGKEIKVQSKKKFLQKNYFLRCQKVQSSWTSLTKHNSQFEKFDKVIVNICQLITISSDPERASQDWSLALKALQQKVKDNDKTQKVLQNLNKKVLIPQLQIKLPQYTNKKADKEQVFAKVKEFSEAFTFQNDNLEKRNQVLIKYQKTFKNNLVAFNDLQDLSTKLPDQRLQFQTQFIEHVSKKKKNSFALLQKCKVFKSMLGSETDKTAVWSQIFIHLLSKTLNFWFDKDEKVQSKEEQSFEKQQIVQDYKNQKQISILNGKINSWLQLPSKWKSLSFETRLSTLLQDDSQRKDQINKISKFLSSFIKDGLKWIFKEQSVKYTSQTYHNIQWKVILCLKISECLGKYLENTKDFVVFQHGAPLVVESLLVSIFLLHLNASLEVSYRQNLRTILKILKAIKNIILKAKNYSKTDSEKLLDKIFKIQLLKDYSKLLTLPEAEIKSIVDVYILDFASILKHHYNQDGIVKETAQEIKKILKFNANPAQVQNELKSLDDGKDQQSKFMSLKSGKWSLIEVEQDQKVQLTVSGKTKEIIKLHHEVDYLYYAAVSQEGPHLNKQTQLTQFLLQDSIDLQLKKGKNWVQVPAEVPYYKSIRGDFSLGVEESKEKQPYVFSNVAKIDPNLGILDSKNFIDFDFKYADHRNMLVQTSDSSLVHLKFDPSDYNTFEKQNYPELKTMQPVFPFKVLQVDDYPYRHDLITLLGSDFNMYQRISYLEGYQKLDLGRSELNSNISQFIDGENSFFVLTVDKILYRFTGSLRNFYKSSSSSIKMMTNKLRDGSSIQKVLQVCTVQVQKFIPKKVGQYGSSTVSLDLTVILAQTSNHDKLVCSMIEKHQHDKHFNLLGRRANPESEPSSTFHMLNYEAQVTNIVKLYAGHQVVYGVDDFGEIWILAGFPQPYGSETCVPIKTNQNHQAIESLNQPICTNEMRRRQAKIIELYPSTYFCIAKIEHLHGSKKEEYTILHGQSRKNEADFDRYKEQYDRLIKEYIESFRQQFQEGALNSLFKVNYVVTGLRNSFIYENQQYQDYIHCNVVHPKSSMIVTPFIDDNQCDIKLDLTQNQAKFVIQEEPQRDQNLLNQNQQDEIVRKIQAMVDRNLKLLKKLTFDGIKSKRPSYLLDKSKIIDEILEINTVQDDENQAKIPIEYLKQFKKAFLLQERVTNLVLVLARNGQELDSEPYKDLQASYKELTQLVQQKMPAYKRFQNTFRSQKVSRIQIDRKAASELKLENRCEKLNENKTIFSRIFNAYKDQLHKLTSTSRAPFSVVMKGEFAYDCGGPMRDAMSNMCDELMSNILPLFEPTSNNQNKIEPHTDSFQINSSPATRDSPQSQQQFNHRFLFLGALLGWATNKLYGLTLDFPPAFWKRLSQTAQGAGRKSNFVYSLEELGQFDSLRRQQIEELLVDKSGLSDEEFKEKYEDQAFEVSFGGENPEPLCENGQIIPLTPQNVDKYVRLYLEAYTRKDQEQMDHMARGLNYICGNTFLAQLSPKLIEQRACSDKVLSYEDFVRKARVHGIDDQVQMLLEILEKDFSSKERQLLVKFATGKSRLGEKDKIDIHFPHMKDDQDQQLPTSYTCSNEMHIPYYSSKEVMKERLLVALTMCGDIDGDEDYMDGEYGESSYNGEDGSDSNDDSSYGSYGSDSGDSSNDSNQSADGPSVGQFRACHVKFVNDSECFKLTKLFIPDPSSDDFKSDDEDQSSGYGSEEEE